MESDGKWIEQDVTYALGNFASMSAEKSESSGRSGSLFPTAAAGLTAILLAFVWTRGIPRSPALGWDEAMHADLPALRILLALQQGEVRSAFDALLDCARYPFVYPAFLSAVQGTFGVGEAVCRAAGTVVWCAALYGLFLLGVELSREDRGRRLAPWIAMAFGALSPMALAFSGTLFLEVPFACVSVYALRAWLRRRSRPGTSSELAAGAWIAACVFTKFNYGLLLLLGLCLDWLCEAVSAARAGEWRAFLRRSASLWLVPVAVALWWFIAPFPAGFEAGLEHRRALAGFLAGNRDFARVPAADRLLHASAWLSLTPRLFVVVAVSAAATLSCATRPAIRTLWLVFAAMAIPMLCHPFHLDRFLIPVAVPLWALAALGLTRMIPDRWRFRPALLAVLAVLCVLYPARAAVRTAEFFGKLSEDPRTRAYQEDLYRRWADLGPSRPLPTAGLAREESDRALDIVAREAGPTARIGWIGVWPELSPGAIHIGLLARGGSVERFLRDAAAPMDVAYFGDDPGWSDEELLAYASRFDVVFASEPPDPKGRPGRAWTRDYRRRLAEMAGFEARPVGSVGVARPMQDVLESTLYACRPKR